MSFTVSLRLVGDGRLRAEEAVGRAIEPLANDPRVVSYFREHPNLRTTSPHALLRSVSRKRGARLIESGVFDSEDEVLDPERVIPRGREIETSIPFPLLLAALDYLPPTPSTFLPMPEVLFENANYLAINKPHDLPSAPIRSDETDSAVHRALRHYPNLPVLRNNPLEPGLVHRLDNGTGGVLLFVKSIEAFERLDREWNTGRVAKIYRALVVGAPDAAGNTLLSPKRVDLRIGHDEKSKKRMRVVVTPADQKRIRGEAMQARTEIVAAETKLFSAVPTAPATTVTDLTIRIETGIHHQIRATLAHLGAPILGDSVYGGVPDERLWLQAWKLVLPESDGSPLEILAPLPKGWPGA